MSDSSTMVHSRKLSTITMKSHSTDNVRQPLRCTICLKTNGFSTLVAPVRNAQEGVRSTLPTPSSESRIKMVRTIQSAPRICICKIQFYIPTSGCFRASFWLALNIASTAAVSVCVCVGILSWPRATTSSRSKSWRHLLAASPCATSRRCLCRGTRTEQESRATVLHCLCVLHRRPTPRIGPGSFPPQSPQNILPNARAACWQLTPARPTRKTNVLQGAQRERKTDVRGSQRALCLFLKLSVSFAVSVSVSVSVCLSGC